MALLKVRNGTRYLRKEDVMIEVIKDVIKENFDLILICGMYFLAGFGIGAGITDRLYREKKKNGKSKDNSNT